MVGPDTPFSQPPRRRSPPNRIGAGGPIGPVVRRGRVSTAGAEQGQASHCCLSTSALLFQLVALES